MLGKVSVVERTRREGRGRLRRGGGGMGGLVMVGCGSILSCWWLVIVRLVHGLTGWSQFVLVTLGRMSLLLFFVEAPRIKSRWVCEVYEDLILITCTLSLIGNPLLQFYIGIVQLHIVHNCRI